MERRPLHFRSVGDKPLPKLRHCRLNLLFRRRLPKNAAAPDQDKHNKCLQEIATRSEFAATMRAHVPKAGDWRTAIPGQRDGTV
jgi:hypothetical protein